MEFFPLDIIFKIHAGKIIPGMHFFFIYVKCKRTAAAHKVLIGKKAFLRD